MHFAPFPEELVKPEDTLVVEQLTAQSTVVFLVTKFKPHTEWIEEFTCVVTSINSEEKYITLVNSSGRNLSVKYSQLKPSGGERPLFSLITLETSAKYMTRAKTSFRYNLDVDDIAA